MLTHGLEQWIQKGKAEYKTFVFGGSGVGTIPVPKNRFIVIIDFDYFPFSDGIINEDTSTDFNNRQVFQVSFTSRKSKNHFLIRQGIVPLGKDNVFPPNFFKKDCYLVHEGDVHIDIVNVPSPDLWNTIYEALPGKSNENPLPVGYGIGGAGVAAVREVDFSATEKYLPLTHYRDDLAPSNYREQFRVDVNDQNKLEDVQKINEIGNFKYPLMNISYVQFNVNINQFVQASN